MRVGGRHTNRRSHHLDAPTLNLVIQIGGEGLVPIMQEIFVILIARKCFPQLLQSPFSSRMLGHIEVDETSGSNLECDEHIKIRKRAVTETKKSQAMISRE